MAVCSNVPRNPFECHPAFPTTPPPFLVNNPAGFQKLGLDTLFFIFYFQQGSIQQGESAKVIKERAWRFHKKYKTWFKRHEDISCPSDEYEEGTYVYFDHETGEYKKYYEWLSR